MKRILLASLFSLLFLTISAPICGQDQLPKDSVVSAVGSPDSPQKAEEVKSPIAEHIKHFGISTGITFLGLYGLRDYKSMGWESQSLLQLAAYAIGTPLVLGLAAHLLWHPSEDELQKQITPFKDVIFTDTPSWSSVGPFNARFFGWMEGYLLAASAAYPNTQAYEGLCAVGAVFSTLASSAIATRIYGDLERLQKELRTKIAEKKDQWPMEPVN